MRPIVRRCPRPESFRWIAVPASTLIAVSHRSALERVEQYSTDIGPFCINDSQAPHGIAP